MRKEIRNKSKTKWIVGGSLAFASVVLLTTGFATWIVGTNIDKDNSGTKVVVDTAYDRSVRLTADLVDNASITVAEENTTDENAPLKVDGNPTPSWTVNFKTLKVEWGADFYAENKDTIKGVKFDITAAVKTTTVDETENETENVNTVNVSSKGEAPDYVGTREAGEYSYVTLATGSTMFSLENVATDSATFATGYDWVTNKETTPSLTFTWGSFFNGQKPTEYYSANIGENDSVVYYSNAIKELKALNTALDDATITITASLVYGAENQTVTTPTDAE